MCRAAAAVCQALQVAGELRPLQGGNISNASCDGDGREAARPKFEGGETACPRPAPSAPPSRSIRTRLKSKFTLVWVGCLEHPGNREPWEPLVSLTSYPILSSLCAPMGALDHLRWGHVPVGASFLEQGTREGIPRRPYTVIKGKGNRG
ncbi:unnamed protein product [Coccothraustes coccothraustes]